MNVDRVVFWIRLIAGALLDILEALGDGPGHGGEKVAGSIPGKPSGFKPERIQVWLGILARAALQAVDDVGVPPAEEPGGERAGAVRSTGRWPGFKPERIQFWIKLVVRFVLAVIDAATDEETGKSGEGSGAPAPGSDAAASREVDW